MSIERKAFDLDKYYDSSGNLLPNASDVLKDDFSSVILEQGERPFHERTNIYTLQIDEHGYLFDSLHGRVGEGLRDDTYVYALEKYAFLNKIEPWVQKPFSDYCLWISPPSQSMSYNESRFVLSFLNQEEGGITNIALCGPQNNTQCLQIAESLSKFSSSTFSEYSKNELRANPIFFNIPEGAQIFKFLSEYIPIPLVWEDIESGMALERIKWAEQISEKVTTQYVRLLEHSKNSDQRIFIGALMETYSASLGAPIQEEGSCGVSNTALYGRKGAYNKFARMHGEKECVYCPICKRSVTVVVFSDRIQCKQCKNFGPALAA